MLEAAQYEDNAFVTLTYDDERLPVVDGRPTLFPYHYQLFLKRLRKALAPVRIRFFIVGEYGDESERPHYHAAIFNMRSCVRGRTRRRPGSGRPVWSECCAICKLVGETWGYGDVDIGMLETSSAQYICGYVTKKMTMRDDYRLKGREPEFARMSLRPGIGASAMDDVASELMRFNLDVTQADVPSSLRHGKRVLPLGRYLTKRLRKLVGKDEKVPEVVLEKIDAEVQPLREAAFDASVSFASALKEANAGKVASFKARQSIFNKGKRRL